MKTNLKSLAIYAALACLTGCVVKNPALKLSSPVTNTAPKIYNVKDYGATGHGGTTDDTAALQATINAASPFGTVYIPNGNYNFSGITLGNGTSPTNVSIVGESTYATLYYNNPSSSGVAIRFNQNQSASFQNFSVVNRSPSRGTTEGIQFSGPNNPGQGTLNENNHFSKVNISQFHYGFHASDAHGNTGSECSFDDVAISSNDIGFLDDDPNGLNFTFNNLQVGWNGVGVQDTEGDGGVYILSGSSAGNGVDFKLSGLGTQIANFRIESNGGTGIIGSPKIVLNAVKMYGVSKAIDCDGAWITANDCILGGSINFVGGPNNLILNNTWVKDTVPARPNNAYGSFQFQSSALTSGNGGTLAGGIPNGHGIFYPDYYQTSTTNLYYTSGDVLTVYPVSNQGNIELDFDGPKVWKISANRNINLSQVSKGDRWTPFNGNLKSVWVYFTGDTVPHALTVPSGWSFMPATYKPAVIPPNVTSCLHLTTTSTGDSSVTAVWSSP